MEGFPDFLFPVSHILCYFIIFLEYRRRKQARTLPDYDHHGYAIWLMAVFLFVIVVAIALALYDFGEQVEPFRLIAKQMLAILMIGFAIWYVLRRRWRVV